MIDIKNEDIALIYKKYALEGKSAKKIANELGIPISDAKKVLKRTFDYLSEYERAEVRNSILDSVEMIKDKFELLIEKTERIIDKAEENGEDMKQLAAIRQLESLLTTALKRLGELRDNFTLKANTVNIQQITFVAKKIQDKIFEDNEAVVENGAIVLKKPKPELIDNYWEWKKKQKIKEVM